jgi:3-keto-5-aminohexanoate cleavage enzyme
MEIMSGKYVFNFAPTGLIPTREMSPHIPLSPAEIVSDAATAIELGVNMLHLHAREPISGEPTYRKEIYAEILQSIRERHPGAILCVSTSGRKFSEFEKRSECLDLTGLAKPDFASLTLSSLNFNNEASLNSPEMIQALARKMLDKGIKPELEAFDVGMINYAKYLIKKGLLKPPYYFNLILGNVACAQASLLHLGLMLNELPEGSIWSVAGVGDYQLKLNALALAAGGGVRVGLEDNLWLDVERTRLATNRELLERVLRIGRALGREPYGQAELRCLFGLG